MAKTLLVTGGCGFIGSNFIRYVLRERSEWTTLINLDKLTYAGSLFNLKDVERDPRYRFIRGDIVDSIFVDEIFDKYRPLAVVNFAAESHVDRSILDPSLFLRSNVLGVQVLLDAAHRYSTDRFVQISTDEVYGDAEGLEVFREDAMLHPSSPYAASKAASDLLCLAYWRTYRFPVMLVRSTNNYGPFQFPEKLIPLMIRNAIRGESLPIYGDGMQLRDWLYVEDNCEAILEILDKGRMGECYNVATGQHISNLEVVKAICRCIAQARGSDVERLFGLVQFVADRPGHDRKYAVDADKMRRELGWSHRMTFQTGIRITVGWYLSNHAWIDAVTTDGYDAYYQAVYGKVRVALRQR